MCRLTLLFLPSTSCALPATVARPAVVAAGLTAASEALYGVAACSLAALARPVMPTAAVAAIATAVIRRVMRSSLGWTCVPFACSTRRQGRGCRVAARRLVAPPAHVVRHSALERPQLDEARARLLREEAAGLAEARQRGVVERVRRAARHGPGAALVEPHRDLAGHL